MTSGGDAPGMNAAIRAVVRTIGYYEMNAVTVRNGYDGLLEGDFEEINAGFVSNTIQRGGTIIRTSRCERFKNKTEREIAYRKLKDFNIDAVIVIGGDGSMKGAAAFSSEFDIPFIGIPKTIDNDIAGTDYAIGFDTATNTVIEAVDKIRDTANSHHRLFFVEVMGREAGFIAMHSGMASGAEIILVPEVESNESFLISRLEKGWERQKSSLIVIVAEEAVPGGAMAIAEKVRSKFNHFDVRVSILGHIQRGGNPSCFDRLLATRLGNAAVHALLDGKKNVLVGLVNDKIKYTPLEKVITRRHAFHKELLEIANEVCY